MSETLGLHLTDEQWTFYIQEVENLINERKKQGALLSTFDLIVGASLLFFLADANDKMPAKWFFAAFRDGMLPDGILDRAKVLERKLDDTQDALESLDLLQDAVADLADSVRGARRKVFTVVDDAKASIAEAKQVEQQSILGA